MQLTTTQQLAVQTAAHNRRCIITGGAGSGKTTVIKSILQCLTSSGESNIVLCAPTGKAAARVTEATGYKAMTVHSACGLFPVSGSEDIGVNHNITPATTATTLVIDETSMVPDDLLAGACRRISPQCRVVLVGDPCLAVGTMVMMASGVVMRIDDVLVGDELMGPDSLPRKVLKKFNGISDLYRVDQTNGDTYIVTGNHKLALRKRGNSGRYPDMDNDVFMDAAKFPETSSKLKEVYGGYKAGCIRFNPISVSVEPYFLGIWLGDGESDQIRVSSSDMEVIDYCRKYAHKMGVIFASRKEREDTDCYRISLTAGKMGNFSLNPIFNSFKAYGLIGNKHIPDNYMYNSEENRLALLAGLIDTDGTWSGNRFVFSSAREYLASQVKQLADQLGFRTNLSEVIYNPEGGNAGRRLWTVTIGGDTWRVPTKVKRKQSTPRNSGRSRTNSTLSVTPVGQGEYFGVEIEGDHLFLLADGTVTHNCQLPPVGAGYPFRDLINSKKVPHVHLDVCHRQDGRLLSNCYDILQGRSEHLIYDAGKGNRRDAEWGFTDCSDDTIPKALTHLFSGDNCQDAFAVAPEEMQIITPMNKGECGRIQLNRLIQRAYHSTRDRVPPEYKTETEKDMFLPGDRVLWKKNDRILGLVNGDVGTVLTVGKDKVVVNFDGVGQKTVDQCMSLQLGWCLTCHATQGSQYDKVLVIQAAKHCGQYNSRIINRSWCYTGGTRSKKATFWLGSAKAFQKHVATPVVESRNTYLSMLV